LLTPHEIYTGLGKTEQERQGNYRKLFSQLLDKELIDSIRDCTNSGFALGSDKFKAEIEALTGVRGSSQQRKKRQAKKQRFMMFPFKFDSDPVY
jgi:putative transposase